MSQKTTRRLRVSAQESCSFAINFGGGEGYATQALDLNLTSFPCRAPPMAESKKPVVSPSLLDRVSSIMGELFAARKPGKPKLVMFR